MAKGHFLAVILIVFGCCLGCGWGGRIRISFEEEDVHRLRRGLEDARPLHGEAEDGWSEGTSAAEMREVLSAWKNFSVPDFLDRINAFEHFTMDNGAGGVLHYVHVRGYKNGPHGGEPLPLLLLHGWPGACLEFLEASKLLGSFNLVIPSLPGFGLSSYIPVNNSENKFVVSTLVAPLQALMRHLNYSRYLVQGGDFGSFLATELCNRDTSSCMGYHLNFVPNGPPLKKGLAGLWDVFWTWMFPHRSFPDPEERRIALAGLFDLKRIWDHTGYLHMHATRPQTLSIALSSSPVAMASWLLDKFHRWDGGLPMQSKLEMLTWWWLTSRDRGLSLRIYRDFFSKDNLGSFMDFLGETRDAPMGYTSCRDLNRTPKKWSQYYHSNMVYYNRAEEAGHFLAWQNPVLFAQEVGRFAFALHLHQKSGVKEL